MTKVLAIGLDGLEISHAERLMAAGKMPQLQALRDRGVTTKLDHGSGGRTGLAWEHFASGRSPQEAKRASAVEFDPATYEVWQEGARLRPFWEDLDVRTLVFDPPYVDLDRAPKTRGVVAWGAHDPGTTFAARPAELGDQLPPYPSGRWTYAVPWSSEELCRQMGESLVEALEARSAAACQMLRDDKDWNLCVVVAGEPHTGAEGLWHGVDPTHPAAQHPSAAAAGAALDDIYVALDRLVGEVVDTAGPDANVVAFSMGGMGCNESDVASMFLLAELLYRHDFGYPLAEMPPAWRTLQPHELTIPDREVWETTVTACFERAAPPAALSQSLLRVARRLPKPARRVLGDIRRRVGASARRTPDAAAAVPNKLSIEWMPTTRYRHRWSEMRAFALPSFYDGRVRINLQGRESSGVVSAIDYEAVCDEIEATIRACRDPRTGEEVVAFVERPTGCDPLRLRSDEADLVVVWRGVFNGFVHPVHGEIGPVPFRRTGGHTGPYGTVVIAGPTIQAEDAGVRSSFDVADMVSQLLAGRPPLEPIGPAG